MGGNCFAFVTYVKQYSERGKNSEIKKRKINTPKGRRRRTGTGSRQERNHGRPANTTRGMASVRNSEMQIKAAG